MSNFEVVLDPEEESENQKEASLFSSLDKMTHPMHTNQ